jgi:hypothetical protein
MANDKIQPDTNHRPEQAKPQQPCQGAQRQADVPSAPVQPDRRATPGRRPLFGY